MRGKREGNKRTLELRPSSNPNPSQTELPQTVCSSGLLVSSPPKQQHHLVLLPPKWLHQFLLATYWGPLCVLVLLNSFPSFYHYATLPFYFYPLFPCSKPYSQTCPLFLQLPHPLPLCVPASPICCPLFPQVSHSSPLHFQVLNRQCL